MISKNSVKTVAQVVVDALLAAVIIGLVPFAWLLRDGLGPDSTNSSGAEAISRCFMTFYAGPIVVTLILRSAACHYSGRSEQPESAEQ